MEKTCNVWQVTLWRSVQDNYNQFIQTSKQKGWQPEVLTIEEFDKRFQGCDVEYIEYTDKRIVFMLITNKMHFLVESVDIEFIKWWYDTSNDFPIMKFTNKSSESYYS